MGVRHEHGWSLWRTHLRVRHELRWARPLQKLPWTFVAHPISVRHEPGESVVHENEVRHEHGVPPSIKVAPSPTYHH